jgi:folate-binding protein YgfZ
MAAPTPLPDRADFGDPAGECNEARTGAVVIDRSHHGKVEVEGADAARFLHNLSTNDVLRLAPGGGCEAFFTTAKARVVAYVLIFRLDSPADAPAFWIDTAPGIAEPLLRHLDHYLISEQVELADHTAAFAQFHVAGPRAAAVLASALGVTPPAAPLTHIGFTFGGQEGQFRRHDALGVSGFDVVCPAAQAGQVWDRLTGAGARPAGLWTYEALRVEAGLPRQGADVDENTFAPEVGRTAQAISYTKGCYLGQEPIVMARDRGQVNRTLLGVKLPAGPVPRGSPLLAGGKEVGRVTSVVHSPRLNMTIGLAYLRRGHQEPGTAVEVDVAGRHSPAEVVKPPF